MTDQVTDTKFGSKYFVHTVYTTCLGHPPPWDSTHCELKSCQIPYIIYMRVSIYPDHSSEYLPDLKIIFSSAVLIFKHVCEYGQVSTLQQHP